MGGQPQRESRTLGVSRVPVTDLEGAVSAEARASWSWFLRPLGAGSEAGDEGAPAAPPCLCTSREAEGTAPGTGTPGAETRTQQGAGRPGGPDRPQRSPHRGLAGQVHPSLRVRLSAPSHIPVSSGSFSPYSQQCSNLEELVWGHTHKYIHTDTLFMSTPKLTQTLNMIHSHRHKWMHMPRH